jgi:branched-chain amino acid transport system permease protein
MERGRCGRREKMSFDMAAALLIDGIAQGAVYVLLATALVLVFTVTRVVFVPQGDLVAFSALTLSAFESGTIPGTVWLVGIAAALSFCLEAGNALRNRDRSKLLGALVWFAAIPGCIIAAALFSVPLDAPHWWKITVTCALTASLAPLLYRLVFQPIASASPLTLLIAAITAHIGLNSIGLNVFGPEGVRTAGFSGPALVIAGVMISRQVLGVLLCSAAVVSLLYLFFRYSFLGRALLASAYNRRGAELVGISTISAGRLAFVLAGLIGAVSGLLIGPMTTLYYDSGFILGLKGFAGAIAGGLTVYPLAALGAIAIGTAEAFASFWASAYRDAIVFTLIIPILLWRSLGSIHPEDEAS